MNYVKYIIFFIILIVVLIVVYNILDIITLSNITLTSNEKICSSFGNMFNIRTSNCDCSVFNKKNTIHEKIEIESFSSIWIKDATRAKIFKSEIVNSLLIYFSNEKNTELNDSIVGALLSMNVSVVVIDVFDNSTLFGRDGDIYDQYIKHLFVYLRSHFISTDRIILASHNPMFSSYINNIIESHDGNVDMFLYFPGYYVYNKHIQSVLVKLPTLICEVQYENKDIFDHFSYMSKNSTFPTCLIISTDMNRVISESHIQPLQSFIETFSPKSSILTIKVT